MFATEIPLLSTTKYPIEKKINIKIKITKASKKKKTIGFSAEARI
jgi:hypothetical protein